MNKPSTNPVSRRGVLKSFGSASAGVLLHPRLIPGGQDAAIRVAGQQVEITVTSISAQTVRVSIVSVENGKPQPIRPDGSLAQQTWPAPVVRLTTLARQRSVRCGELRVNLSPEPLTVRVEAGDGRLVQQLLTAR